MEAWLSARFGRDRAAEGLGRIPPIEAGGDEEDFFAELLLRAPDETLELIKRTAQFLKVHRTARAGTVEIDRADFERLADAVGAFASWYHDCGVTEPVTAALIEDLGPAADMAREAVMQPLTGRRIAELLFHQPPSACKQGKGEFKQWRAKTKWKGAAKAVGKSVAQGEQLSAAGEKHYGACAEAYAALCKQSRRSLV